MTYSRYVAPLVEELAKGAVLIYLIRSDRVGFLVDAAIFGFALGAGFALVENLYYLNFLADAHVIAWVVHSFFNHFLLSPVVSTLVILLGLPPLIVLAFQRSEAGLREWLDVGFDADAQLLELIRSGELSESRVGRYLHLSLADGQRPSWRGAPCPAHA